MRQSLNCLHTIFTVTVVAEHIYELKNHYSLMALINWKHQTSVCVGSKQGRCLSGQILPVIFYSISCDWVLISKGLVLFLFFSCQYVYDAVCNTVSVTTENVNMQSTKNCPSQSSLNPSYLPIYVSTVMIKRMANLQCCKTARHTTVLTSPLVSAQRVAGHEYTNICNWCGYNTALGVSLGDTS